MKHHLALKFCAILFAAVALLTAVLGTWGLIGFSSLGLYSGTLENVQNKQMALDMQKLSERIASRYAASQNTASTQAFLDSYYDDYDRSQLIREPEYGMWYYELVDYNTGKVVEITPGSPDVSGAMLYKEFQVMSSYPLILSILPVDDTLLPDIEDLLPPEENPEQEPQYPADSYEYTWEDPTTGEDRTYILKDTAGAIYTVRIYLLPGAYEQQVAFLWELLGVAYANKYLPLWVLPIGLLMLAAMLTWLFAIIGKKGSRIEPNGLNRLPLDLYLAVTAGGGYATFHAVAILLRDQFTRQTAGVIAGGALLMIFVSCLLVIGFLCAMVSQLKLGQRYWWQHSALRALLQLLSVGFGALKRLVHRLTGLMSLGWQWVVWATFMAGILVAAVLVGQLWLMIVAGLFIAISLFYAISAYKTLYDGARRMSTGDLETPVDSKQLMGSFSEFATHLNTLADVATVAAQKQMRSERLRAELITNVSHDIRTPLTSIINYVDLMKTAQDQQTSQQYLEVLSRQSARMKKLIDDLIELSKATTGNMTVELTQLDAAEYITQALGEYSDKLERASLEPVVRLPQGPVQFLCDSRLTWRVLSNLLSNAVKYALPGTRVYVDLEQKDGQVLLSLKNISRSQLNISPEELMERFVRGDTARNTEGSGLGLNIAKSLMELQKGQLTLSVDGDLFKATVHFAAAQPTQNS